MIRINLFHLLLFICMIFEIYSQQPAYHFLCQDAGIYIPDSSFCDGTVVCIRDKSDENYGCDRQTCGQGKFKCTADGACMDITVRCNNRKDCTDGSDELNCGNEVDIEGCPSREGSFLCEDKTKCINFEYTCDGQCNCLDCSDEHSGCLQYDNYLCEKCSDTCYLNENYTEKFFKPPARKFRVAPCQVCQYELSCDRTKCMKIEAGKQRCLCDENFERNGFGRRGQEICINTVPYENVIVYSTPNQLKLFNLTTNETITLGDEVNCTAFAAAHDHVYYATRNFTENKESIFKTSITSKETQRVIDSDSPISSIAIDWITNNIYYTTDTSMIVCSNDGRICATLRSCAKCRVKLSPKIGLMFWSENDQLFQSEMDGSNKKNFTDGYSSTRYSSDTFSQLSFDVDESADTVYWSRHLPEIKCARMFVENPVRTFLMYGVSDLPNHIVDWDEYEYEIIYYTLVNSNSIYLYEWDSKARIRTRVTDQNVTAIKNILVYNRLLQRTKIPNPCANSNCSLCLLQPFSSFIGLNRVCKCRNVTSTDDKFSCGNETISKSKTTPDATARKRVIYDYDDDPSTWKDFLLSFKTVIIIIAVILLSVGVWYGLWMKKKVKHRRLNVTADPNDGL